MSELPEWYPKDRKATGEELRRLAKWDEEQFKLRKEREAAERPTRKLYAPHPSVAAFKAAIRKGIENA